jgi:DNA-binding Xre family transcriptional regulator
MSTSYNKLFKLLIDKGMAKGELCRLSGVSKASVAKLKTGQSVSVSLIEKICLALDCDFGDVMEYVSDKPKEESNVDQ